MSNPTLKFAISHYDRYVPILDGVVRPRVSISRCFTSVSPRTGDTGVTGTRG